MTPLMSSALLRAQTDDRLVRMAADGHDRAFEAIVERYRRPLLRYLRRLLSDTLAEDVVQATFLNAWSSLRAGTDVRELRPWLYRIAHNAAINALKKVGEAMEEIPESVGGFATEPAAEFERRDEMHRALHSIAALPSRQRTALLAVAVDGRAHSEVAQELGLTDGAVRQLVHRARTTLRTGATAITPPPLLYAVVASAGDSTVARVAEVAAGAGGAGAASLSLKAGAAAVLATGALVTGGTKIDHVVHPSQHPAQATVRHAPAPAPTPATTAATNAAAPVPPAKPPPNHSGARWSSGRTHKQRRRGHEGKSSGSPSKGRRDGAAERDRRGSNSGSSETTSGHRRGSTSSGNDNDGSATRRGGTSGEQESGSGKHNATTTHGTTTTGGGKTGGGKKGGGDDDLVVKPPSTAPPAAGGGESGGGHAEAAPAPTETTPPPTVTDPPTTAPPEPDTGTVRTEPDGGGGG